MIAYEDFVPKVLNPGHLFQSAVYEDFDHAVESANKWILAEQIDVVNVETVVLPNVHSSQEEGSNDPAILSYGEFNTLWHQFIRVWYRRPL
jgi:hypothetical protein